jgi:CheY-like chemotaxis protein
MSKIFREIIIVVGKVILKMTNCKSHILYNPEKNRILIVDDDYDIIVYFKTALEESGFNVEVFTDPLEALAKFKSDYYDLLLIDIRMPRLDGFELYKKLRKRDVKFKVCFITSFGTYYEAMIEEHPSIKKELNCFIRKPITTIDLLKCIKGILHE